MRISLSFVLSAVINFILFAFILPNMGSFIFFESKPQSLNITIVSQLRTTESEKNTANIEKSVKKTEKQAEDDIYKDPIIKALSEYNFSKKNTQNDVPRIGIIPKSRPYSDDRYSAEENIFDTRRLIQNNNGTEFIDKRIDFEELSQEKIISFEELAKIGIPNFSQVLKDLQKDYELKLKAVSQDKARFLQGNVLVQLDIEKDGRVSNIKVLESPDPILADISIRNILKLRPSPRNSTLKGLRVRIEFERK